MAPRKRKNQDSKGVSRTSRTKRQRLEEPSDETAQTTEPSGANTTHSAPAALYPGPQLENWDLPAEILNEANVNDANLLAKSRAKVDGSWMKAAKKGFNSRMNSREKNFKQEYGIDRQDFGNTNRAGVRIYWWHDVNQDDYQTLQLRKLEGTEIDCEDDHVRYDDAAHINALLNYAVMPPIGYYGHIRYLIDSEHLSTQEIEAARQSRRGLNMLQKKHDQAFDNP